MLEFFIVAVIIFVVVFFIGLYFFCKRIKRKYETKEANDTSLKFCKDCKFFMPDTTCRGDLSIKYAKCKRSIRIGSDDSNYFVTGIAPVNSNYTCSVERQFECGKEAKFFEKIESTYENRK